LTVLTLDRVKCSDVKRQSIALAGLLLVCFAAGASAQDTVTDDGRTQYPAFMNDSYFTFDLGSIGYLFSGTQLEPGFRAETIQKPRLAARIDFFGHRFTKNFSMQVTYWRPFQFVGYRNVNGDETTWRVSNAYAGLTLVLDRPLTRRVSGYVEGGFGLTSRSGIIINNQVALRGVRYSAGVLGAGFAYHATSHTDVMFRAAYSPGRKSFNQPSTRIFTTGLRYNMHSLTAEQVQAKREAGFSFPSNLFRFGYTTNQLEYGFNDLFTRWIPIFFGGNVETRYGFTVDYERNVFHTKKRFAFDLGVSASSWKSDGQEVVFRTFSAYPLLRFFLVRSKPADVYFRYSLAGPTVVSPSRIDGRDTGGRFTFQDALGFGAYLGSRRRWNGEIGIKHYSNGNIFPSNAGIKIPLTLSLGFAF